MYRFALLPLFLLLLQPAGARHTRTITILHTNDTHSQVMPFSTHLADTVVAGRGGYARRMELIRREREADPELLVLDSGDFSQGSPYYTLYHGDVETGLMSLMGVDGATIGNHEFDFGLDNLARLARAARFPIICSNYRVAGTPLVGLVEPYHIYKVRGVRVGVFALAPRMEGLVDARNCRGVEYLDPVATAREMVRVLRGEKHCDVVILLSHLGWKVRGTDDAEVIRHTRGLDLVLGGHSHTYFDTLRYETDPDGRQVPVDQNGKGGVYVGKVVLSVE